MFDIIIQICVAILVVVGTIAITSICVHLMLLIIRTLWYDLTK